MRRVVFESEGVARIYYRNTNAFVCRRHVYRYDNSFWIRTTNEVVVFIEIDIEKYFLEYV